MKVRTNCSIVALALVVGLSGCDRSAGQREPADNPAAPAPKTNVGNRERFDGFSFNVPGGWTRVPTDDPKNKAKLLLGTVPSDMPKGVIPESTKGLIKVDAGTPKFASPKETAASFAKDFGGEVLPESVAIDGERGVSVRISSQNAALMPRQAIVVGRKGRQYMIMAGSVGGVDVSDALEGIRTTWKWED
jgi:hypothetical protein